MTGRWVVGLVGCAALLGCSADPVPRPAPAVTPGSPAPKLDPGLVPTPVASDPVAGSTRTAPPEHRTDRTLLLR